VITSLANGQYRHRTFYPEKKQCTQLLTVTDKNFDIKEGEYKEWWDDGFKKVEGQYEADMKVGVWKNYSFDTGKLQSETIFVNGEKNGIQKNYGKHGLSTTYTYVNNQREGPFTVYDSTSIVVNQGTYRSDTLYEQSRDMSKDKPLLKVVEEMPRFPGCTNTGDEDAYKSCSQRKMLENIYGNIRYPADARENGLEGTAIIRFLVDKDGSIIDAVALRGLCRSIENECLRIVNDMPTWDPGKQDGKTVKVQFNLPIKFKLQ
jgi:TonB family protein